jgi:hypothetical protein
MKFRPSNSKGGKMKKVILAALLFAASTLAATVYNLPSTGGTVTWASGYGGNTFWYHIPVTLNGVASELSVTAHILPDNTLYPPLSNVRITNLATGAYTDHPLSGTWTQGASSDDDVQHFTLSGTFDTGKITLNITGYTQDPPCYRGCHTNYVQAGSTITVE